ncbi:chorismate synthase [Helicobacter enhydrae]|uniref:Chorismate synthase n=1 Tax=Helicobacter enhydrae TaxID=222136 RepID=A0A1B1U6H4_9HELI|nr:chorismate synthase [Helicobacter enhydrae]ANV98358.1 chorismate synthase [Helicobacter enhydrae]
MNTFGYYLRLTTFGESHGVCVGGVLDGVPSGLGLDWAKINDLLERRKGGRSHFVTQRKEKDEVEILSGVFEGKTTGAPIAFLIKNADCKSSDYEQMRECLRPSHADFTYFQKYGHYDYRGGGRSSARESVVRVVASGIIEPILKSRGIEVYSGVCGIGGIEDEELDFDFASKSEICSITPKREAEQIELLQEVRQSQDSIGGVVALCARGDLLGLGEPLYRKLDGALAEAMMGINGVKAVEIGKGIKASQMRGSAYNDLQNRDGFLSNHSGGILGGIGNGEELVMRVHFKPTASIFLPQKTINRLGEEVVLRLKGRHDPCIAIRGSVVAESMMRLVLAEMILGQNNFEI